MSLVNLEDTKGQTHTLLLCGHYLEDGGVSE